MLNLHLVEWPLHSHAERDAGRERFVSVDLVVVMLNCFITSYFPEYLLFSLSFYLSFSFCLTHPHTHTHTHTHTHPHRPVSSLRLESSPLQACARLILGPRSPSTSIPSLSLTL